MTTPDDHRSNGDSAAREPAQLHILVADQRQERLEQMAATVRALGHELAGRELEIAHVAELTRREDPDLALVGLGEDSEHALELITRIVNEATCPVITVLDGQAPEFVREAAKRGIFAAYITGPDPEVLQSTIEIVLARFSEYHSLRGAFGRRAIIEQAKGILMDRHGIDEQAAFGLLRDTSRRDGRKLINVAHGVIDNHLLLPRAPRSTPETQEQLPA